MLPTLNLVIVIDRHTRLQRKMYQAVGSGYHRELLVYVYSGKLCDGIDLKPPDFSDSRSFIVLIVNHSKEKCY